MMSTMFQIGSGLCHVSKEIIAGVRQVKEGRDVKLLVRNMAN